MLSIKSTTEHVIRQLTFRRFEGSFVENSTDSKRQGSTDRTLTGKDDEQVYLAVCDGSQMGSLLG